MSRNRGFTLIEVLVVIFIIVVLITVLVPFPCRARNVANRAVCAANIRGIYVAMTTYAKENVDWFPVAGTSDPGKPVVGFVRGLRGPDGRPNDQGMVNNVTASLWKLIHNGSVGHKGFICPASGNKMGMQLGSDGRAMLLLWPLDFAGAENLSYSPVNMYHDMARTKWSANASANIVVLGDNNNADGVGVHTLSEPGDSAQNIQTLENSQNHFGDGQNFAFGDGHVSFSNDPFVGPGKGNVYATVIGVRTVPPTMSNTEGDGTALLPVTGNNGVSLSGLAGPGQRTRPGNYDWVWPVAALIGVIVVAVGICLLIDGMRRLTRGAKTPGGAGG